MNGTTMRRQPPSPGLEGETNPWFRNAVSPQNATAPRPSPTDFASKSYREQYPGLYERWDEQQGQIQGLDRLLASNRGMVGDLKSQLAELAEARSLLTMPGDWITQWLLGKQTMELERRLNRATDSSNWMVMEQEAMKTAGWAGPSASSGGRRDWVLAHLPSEFGQEAGRLATPSMSEVTPSPSVSPPIPDWMRQYFETTMAGTRKVPEGATPQGGRAGVPWQERQAFALRPLGAQAELDIDELSMLQGYMGWTKAGAPIEFGADYVKGLERADDWWEQYKEENLALHPSKGKLPVRWQPTRQ